MGVPAFFRWLSSRNPKIIINAQNNDDDFTDPDNNPEDNVNPYIDNFYLDMNGIIHPCCHPQNNQFPPPQSFDEMVNNIYAYVDYLMNIVRPQKLLYLAIDGVAPRAKMNQQRCRRFRACQEREESKKKKEKLRDHWKENGQFDQSIDNYINEQGFDSNVITPGTEFMHNLSVSIQAYIYERMNTHPLWKNLNVVFSDANIPGEGEHKILEFIRLQRAQKGYNPDTHHCLYGADADLLMLGLSTHEPYFYIIREQVISDEQKSCTICGNKGHFFTECKANNVDDAKDFGKDDIENDGSKKIRELPVTFQYAKLQIMREYFEMEFKELQLDFDFDLENIIDDFNFMCFFVGNDFIPHIPSLSIRDGGIDALMLLYKSFLPEFGGYLTQGQKVNLKRVSILLSKVAQIEQVMIEDKQRREERNRQRDLRNKQLGINNNNKNNDNDDDAIDESESETVVQKFKKEMKEINQQAGIVPDELSKTAQEFEHLNYREIWYREKFDVAPEDFKEFKQNIKQSYAEALCWNYAYYYRGCISWNWYYPYHYAPFASDLDDLHKLKIDFEYGNPFQPFQQLLSVFPPGSKSAIPKCYHPLMTDPESPIIDFYPLDFHVDLKGKKFAWLGEIILPFIDEDRLIEASSKYENQLTKEEQFRNRLGKTKFFIHTDRYKSDFKDKNDKKVLTWPELGLAGEIAPNTGRFQIGGKISLPYTGLKLEQVENNQVEEIFYDNPQYQLHKCKLLDNVTMPEPEINDESYLGKVDKRMYMGQNVIRLITKNLDLPQQQFKTGMGRLNQYYQQNQQSNLNNYNNQFVARQQEMGSVNFQMGSQQQYRPQRQQYQRINEQQHGGNQQQYKQNYNQNYNNNYNQNRNQQQNYGQNYNQNYKQNQYNQYNNNNGYNQNRRNNQYQYNQGNNGQYQNQGYNNNNNNNRNQKQTYSQRMNLNSFQQQPAQQQYQPKQQQQQPQLSNQQQHYQNNQPYFVKNAAKYQPNFNQNQDKPYDPYQEFDQIRKQNK